MHPTPFWGCLGKLSRKERLRNTFENGDKRCNGCTNTGAHGVRPAGVWAVTDTSVGPSKSNTLLLWWHKFVVGHPSFPGPAGTRAGWVGRIWGVRKGNQGKVDACPSSMDQQDPSFTLKTGSSQGGTEAGHPQAPSST